MTQEQRDQYLTHIRNGMRRGAAAEAMGLERMSTLVEVEGDHGFLSQVVDAEREATEHVEEALYQAAVSGHVGAAVKWLELNEKPSASPLPQLDEDDVQEFLKKHS